jgi:hypothetical protein
MRMIFYITLTSLQDTPQIDGYGARLFLSQSIGASRSDCPSMAFGHGSRLRLPPAIVPGRDEHGEDAALVEVRCVRQSK